MAAFGAPEEILLAAQSSPSEILVFEENWDIVEMFQRLTTQWVWSSGGGALGLNYQSLEFMFNLYKVKDRRQMFECLQIMELAAIQVFNEKD